VVIVLTTLLTPAERRDTLVRFHERCTPVGFWGPVASNSGVKAGNAFRRDLATCGLGIVICACMVVLLNACIRGSLPLILGSAALMVVSAVIFMLRWRTGERRQWQD
jgi:hypothetical protein